jgi:hypothetical protein
MPMPRTSIRLIAVATASLAIVPPAAAQAPAAAVNPAASTLRFAGVVQAVGAGGEYTVRVTDGSNLSFRLASDARLMARQPARLADLKAGGFIGCTAVPGKGDALRATECHIFPESMRGAGEGHYPWQDPGSTMTNGNVATMTNGAVQTASGSAQGVRLKVEYKGGQQWVEASAQTEVTRIAALAPEQIKVGAHVTGAVRQAANGSAEAVFLSTAP